jgi:endonuclease/exonuclease/phosphatase family metal-dependent hydrolase
VKRKKAAFIILIIVTCINTILYLIASVIPFAKDYNNWFLAFLGLGFPFLLCMQALLILVWVWFHKKRALLLFILSLAGLKQIQSLAAFNLKEDKEAFAPEAVRILSWNVSRWDERNKQKRGGVSYRPLMMDYIKMQNADILCFQEFFECLAPEYFEENIPVFKKMGYPYYYFTPSAYLANNKFQYGLCIFSRHPIKDSGFFNIAPRVHAEGISFADISIDKKVVRVFNARLESPALEKEDFYTNGTARLSKTTLSKLKYGFGLRNLQATYLKKLVTQSPHPAIVCIDMNDVSTSGVYYTVKGSLKDAFLEKGKGLGRTYRLISPFMRIDYIFADKHFSIRQFEKGDCIYSDHYPLTASFALVSR